MFRSVCSPLIFALLSGVVCADVLLSENPEIFPTSSTEETSTPVILVTHTFTDGITDTATTSEPATSTITEATSEPGQDASTVTAEPDHAEGASRSPPTSPTTRHSSAATVAPTTRHSSAATVAPTTRHSSAATVAPTTRHSSAATVAPTTRHSSAATTVAPTTRHSSAATTVAPTTRHSSAATTVAPTTRHSSAATTVAPTTRHSSAATTVAPTTRHSSAATTVAPTTIATSTPAPTTTVPPLPNPTVGDYFVRPDPNASICLMAKMGLQFSFMSTVGAKIQTINVDPSPNVTTINGTCGSYGSDAVLTLTSDKIAVQFTFTNQTNKFHLRVLNFTVDTGNGTTFAEVNTNLSLWEASLGSSYMCRKEQSYNITDKLTLNTFELQVQPFGVTNDQFSTALECSVDDASLLVPIIVGAALAGLILIVVIAYVIGRRKTYVGYQTL